MGSIEVDILESTEEFNEDTMIEQTAVVATDYSNSTFTAHPIN